MFAADLYELDVMFWNANGGLNALLAPEAVAFIAELAVIWAFVAVANLAVRHHVLPDQDRSGHLLLYGIYLAGFLGLIVVLLSSPAVPHLTTSS